MSTEGNWAASAATELNRSVFVHGPCSAVLTSRSITQVSQFTTRQPTAHYYRSQQQELAPVLVLVGGDGHRRPRHPWIQQIGDGTPFSIRDEWSKARRRGHWPLWVDATDLCCLRDLMMMMMTVHRGENCACPVVRILSHLILNLPRTCGGIYDNISLAASGRALLQK